MQRHKDKGSSPFIRTENPLHERVLDTDQLTHLAHFDLECSPGGDNLNRSMTAKDLVLCTTGKRWFVKYYITNLEGKRERCREYGYVNREKDPVERMKLLEQLKVKILDYFTGHSSLATSINQSTRIYKASATAVAQKRGYLKENAYLAVRKNIKPWLKFLLLKNLELKQIDQIKSSDILDYRNWRLQLLIKKKSGEIKRISNRTVNNNIDDLRTLFNELMKVPGVTIKENPCNSIVNIPSRSEVHVAYTDDEAISIAARLKEKDPHLLLYIKFIAYIFFRCSEARLLQVKHFDIPKRKITLPADNNKTNIRTHKLIPEIVINDILAMELHKYPKDYYIFSSGELPGPVPVNKDYFSKKFRPHKKHFGFTNLHTIYGFRHTFVCQLIESGMPWHKIMKLTGHKTMSSFEKYVRSIMQRPAEDLSAGFMVKM